MSDNFSLIIKNGSCYINGELVKTDLGLSGEKNKKIGKIELNSSKVIDATDKLVLPGIIDTQVHFREPGSTDAEDLKAGVEQLFWEALPHCLRCLISIRLHLI